MMRGEKTIAAWWIQVEEKQTHDEVKGASPFSAQRFKARGGGVLFCEREQIISVIDITMFLCVASGGRGVWSGAETGGGCTRRWRAEGE